MHFQSIELCRIVCQCYCQLWIWIYITQCIIAAQLIVTIWLFHMQCDIHQLPCCLHCRPLILVYFTSCKTLLLRTYIDTLFNEKFIRLETKCTKRYCMTTKIMCYLSTFRSVSRGLRQDWLLFSDINNLSRTCSVDSSHHLGLKTSAERWNINN